MSRREAALAEAREAVEQRGLEALVCLFDGVHSYLEANPIFDLTGFKAMDEAAAIVDGDGVLLVVSPAWDADRARECAGSHVRVVAVDDVAGELASRLSGMAPVGVVGLGSVPRRLADAVAAAARETVAADDAVLGRQRPKDDEEIAKARRASEVAEQAYGVMLESLRPGVTEYELVARLDAEVTRLGGDDDFLLMSSAPSGRPVRAPSARRLEAGDVLNAEISPSVAGQFVQICRTAIVGPATSERREDYELLLTALRAGMDTARPGATVAEVVAAIDEPIVAAGFPQYTRPPHIRVRGHGQGIASLSPGDIVHDNDVVLEEGMVFTMHPNQPTPRSGYMMCGEPVIITTSGARALTRTPLRLFETGQE